MHDVAHGTVVTGDTTARTATESSPGVATRQSGWALAVKRALDVVGAVVGLVVLSPLFVLIALAIKRDSAGPVLFRQERLGKGGRPFEFYKFRTMVDGNDQSIHREYVSLLICSESEELKGETGAFKIEADPRVTRFGHILRRTSLDELPQLINVVLGDMSLVGPRPPIDYEVELYGPRERARFDVLPGITGLWQVSGRSQKTYQEMIDLDLRYIETWSLPLDLQILGKTVFVVLGRKGAW
jgi:lipopolysaccharide/colanic/teichoic acid biosynthesis glycosyltransferase